MLARLSAARRLPRVAGSVRMYTVGRSEGSVAESKGFNKKEKAHEDQYVHRHEQEQLAKLKQQISSKKEELAKLEKEHDTLETKTNGQ